MSLCTLANISIKAPDHNAAFYAGMIILVLIVAGTFGAIVARRFPQRKGAVLWTMLLLLAVPAVLALSGMTARMDLKPPPPMLIPLYILVLSFGFSFSKMGRRLSAGIEIKTLVALNIFRLPLEIYMHQAAIVGIMPELFSFGGYNFDILTGIFALILTLIFLSKKQPPKALLWAWNLLGIAFLLVIAVLAITSSPVIHAFGTDPSQINSWVLYFPYIWLPTALVPIAVVSHIIVTRKLRECPQKA